ncbi:Phospholipid:diacylglycerol acyltransferase [Staphylotrichum tortipilum]|uniref:Phospholipid:diacylglycerol acyltransferase n=1 Tax=Staphylotrichum tortipilum TaxID=2831512 RepID=A0AAN6MQX4_9PEZI|nr:Phospholipid:diacylglycerol acyltransferase [Staphylotrichum longicolle]
MASTLRRRVVDTDTPSESPTPRDENPKLPERPENPSGPVQIIHHHRPKTRKRKTTAIFLLGSLFGIIAAGFFAKSNDLIDFPELGELSMDSIFDVLPAGLVKDMRELIIGERDFLESYDAFSVGQKMSSEGLEANHPMVMSWGTSNISLPYFRKRLWGSWSMMRALVLDKDTWKAHVMLDKKTGLDPPGIKLRAAQGFDATDFFITGYWIWNKIIENLASLGYDPVNSYTAAYDWRLAYQSLETRDRYFTKLKAHIEMAVLLQNKKIVLTSHSMGSQVVFYFFHWVTSKHGGRGGHDWVENHIESWINDVSALLSGEMRDTAQLNAFAVYGLEKFLSKAERVEIFRAMPGMSSMLPMGGNAIWGDLDGAPDDQPGQEHTYGAFLNFRPGLNWTAPERNFTVDDAMDYLVSTSEDWYKAQLKRSYSWGIAKTTAEVEANEHDPVKWVNPLETRLPLAPNLKIYCFYGVGKPTERGYYYRAPEYGALTNLSMTIDTGLTQGTVDHGVIMGEGDGTGWKLKRYNPANVKITVVEMPHEPDRFNPRGGPNTADHVDILGRQNLNEFILKIAAGRGDIIEDHIVSNIRQYADRAKLVGTLSSSCATPVQLDEALRSWLDLTSAARAEHLESEDDIARCSQLLLESPIFCHNCDYVRTQLIYSLLQEQDDEFAKLHVYANFLLLDGRTEEDTFRTMINEGCFGRLLELIKSCGDRDPRLHRLLLQLLYEMSRIERLRPEDLLQVDDGFVTYLFRLIEALSDDAADPYHYPVIRVLLVLNEQYMVASTSAAVDPSSLSVQVTNRVVKVLSVQGPSFRTFGENLILLLNRETETSQQLLILKLLYLLFTTAATYEYFYTNDLRVLLDVIIRNLLDLPSDMNMLRHTYLRVLAPLLSHTQLSQPPHYKQDQIISLLEILRGAGSAHFLPPEPTTLRLVERVAKIPWLAEVEQESPNTSPVGSLTHSQTGSSVSVIANVSEKPGVKTPSRKLGMGQEPKMSLPEVPKHRHGVPLPHPAVTKLHINGGAQKKLPPKLPPPRRKPKANSLREGDVVAITPGWRSSKRKRHVVKHIIAPGSGVPIEERPPVPTEEERCIAREEKRAEKKERRAARDLADRISRRLTMGEKIIKLAMQNTKLRAKLGEAGFEDGQAAQGETQQ